ncbi:MAG: putative D-inositol 3-phosphate glycosyltransferase 2 protein [Candidatus Thorarchaeota archaeon]|nr:MAG: putative D-inositol 3-phosphate glycosyltransferase 2 protein [Candidatus Thorarchaeota archaeon]
MRVIIISQYFPPDMGGGATRAYNVARGLISSGVDVTVVCATPHYPDGKIPSKYLKKPFLVELQGKIKTIRTFVPPIKSDGFLRRIILFFSFIISSLLAIPYIRKADVIWTANPNVIGIFAGLIYRFVYDCSLIQNVDDLWPEVLFDLGVRKKSIMGRIGGYLAAFSYKTADGITPISPAYKKTIIRKYGVNSGKIKVIKAGVDIERFKPQKISKRSNFFTVLYIGAFSPTYNFEQIFRAAELLAEYKDIRFLIQGGGEMIDLLRKLESQVESNNIEVREKIVSRDEVARIINEADVVLLPLCGVGSIEKGISSKLYEYQAMGKPILCCSSGQPGAYVTESHSGIVIKPGDFRQLADSIIELKENPQKSTFLGCKGREYVEKKLSIESIGMEMRDFLMQMANKN